MNVKTPQFEGKPPECMHSAETPHYVQIVNVSCHHEHSGDVLATFATEESGLIELIVEFLCRQDETLHYSKSWSLICVWRYLYVNMYCIFPYARNIPFKFKSLHYFSHWKNIGHHNWGKKYIPLSSAFDNMKHLSLSPCRSLVIELLRFVFSKLSATSIGYFSL